MGHSVPKRFTAFLISGYLPERRQAFRHNLQSTTTYTAKTPESDDIELLTPEDIGWHSESATSPTTRTKFVWLSEATAWKALTLSLVLSLAISAINLTFLSAWVTVSSRYGDSTTLRPLEYPNVYIGLDTVAHDPSQCLNRGTFPDNFYTYDAREGSKAQLDRVYAPDDEVTLSFGGPIRAVMETRVLDYGLENCTFVAHSNATRLGQGQGVDWTSICSPPSSQARVGM